MLPAAPADVWALLTDPLRLARLLGCDRLVSDGPDRYKAEVKFAIAAVSGKYAGSLELSQKKPPRSLVLKFDGKGLPGFVRGEGRIELSAQGSAQTEVRYSGEAQVGGVIAAVGQRMLEGAARKIVQQFFASAAAELKAAPTAEPAVIPRSASGSRRKGS